jgi:hypothetical protein
MMKGSIIQLIQRKIKSQNIILINIEIYTFMCKISLEQLKTIQKINHTIIGGDG